MGFSDPMVDVLAALGNFVGIKPFYVSFVLAPLASNASELVASMNYASKKTKSTSTTSLSTLLGAANMNNTFCLAIFYALIVCRTGLKWTFSAETIVIVGVQVIMFFFCVPKHHEAVDGLGRLVFLSVVHLVGGMVGKCKCWYAIKKKRKLKKKKVVLSQ